MSSMHVRGPTAEIWLSALQFLGQEVKHLDDQNWEGWLALYTPDAEYWVPAWDTDGSLVSDPSKHVSLIYYKNRGGVGRSDLSFEDRSVCCRHAFSTYHPPVPDHRNDGVRHRRRVVCSHELGCAFRGGT